MSWNHVFWNKESYKSSPEHRLRRFGGFILPTLIEPHNELHATLEPPMKPTATQIHELFNLIKLSDNRNYMELAIGYFEGAEPRIA